MALWLWPGSLGRAVRIPLQLYISTLLLTVRAEAPTDFDLVWERPVRAALDATRSASSGRVAAGLQAAIEAGARTLAERSVAVAAAAAFLKTLQDDTEKEITEAATNAAQTTSGRPLDIAQGICVGLAEAVKDHDKVSFTKVSSMAAQVAQPARGWRSDAIEAAACVVLRLGVHRKLSVDLLREAVRQTVKEQQGSRQQLAKAVGQATFLATAREDKNLLLIAKDVYTSVRNELGSTSTAVEAVTWAVVTAAKLRGVDGMKAGEAASSGVLLAGAPPADRFRAAASVAAELTPSWTPEEAGEARASSAASAALVELGVQTISSSLANSSTVEPEAAMDTQELTSFLTTLDPPAEVGAIIMGAKIAEFVRNLRGMPRDEAVAAAAAAGMICADRLRISSEGCATAVFKAALSTGAQKEAAAVLAGRIAGKVALDEGKSMEEAGKVAVRATGEIGQKIPAIAAFAAGITATSYLLGQPQHLLEAKVLVQEAVAAAKNASGYDKISEEVAIAAACQAVLAGGGAGPEAGIAVVKGLIGEDRDFRATLAGRAAAQCTRDRGGTVFAIVDAATRATAANGGHREDRANAMANATWLAAMAHGVPAQDGLQSASLIRRLAVEGKHPAPFESLPGGGGTNGGRLDDTLEEKVLTCANRKMLMSTPKDGGRSGAEAAVFTVNLSSDKVVLTGVGNPAPPEQTFKLRGIQLLPPGASDEPMADEAEGARTGIVESNGNFAFSDGSRGYCLPDTAFGDSMNNTLRKNSDSPLCKGSYLSLNLASGAVLDKFHVAPEAKGDRYILVGSKLHQGVFTLTGQALIAEAGGVGAEVRPDQVLAWQSGERSYCLEEHLLEAKFCDRRLGELNRIFTEIEEDCDGILGQYNDDTAVQNRTMELFGTLEDVLGGKHVAPKVAPRPVKPTEPMMEIADHLLAEMVNGQTDTDNSASTNEGHDSENGGDSAFADSTTNHRPRDSFLDSPTRRTQSSADSEYTLAYETKIGDSSHPLTDETERARPRPSVSSPRSYSYLLPKTLLAGAPTAGAGLDGFNHGGGSLTKVLASEAGKLPAMVTPVPTPIAGGAGTSSISSAGALPFSRGLLQLTDGEYVAALQDDLLRRAGRTSSFFATATEAPAPEVKAGPDIQPSSSWNSSSAKERRQPGPCDFDPIVAAMQRLQADCGRHMGAAPKGKASLLATGQYGPGPDPALVTASGGALAAQAAGAEAAADPRLQTVSGTFGVKDLDNDKESDGANTTAQGFMDQSECDGLDAKLSNMLREFTSRCGSLEGPNVTFGPLDVAAFDAALSKKTSHDNSEDVLVNAFRVAKQGDWDKALCGGTLVTYAGDELHDMFQLSLGSEDRQVTAYRLGRPGESYRLESDKLIGATITAKILPGGALQWDNGHRSACLVNHALDSVMTHKRIHDSDAAPFAVGVCHLRATGLMSTVDALKQQCSSCPTAGVGRCDDTCSGVTDDGIGYSSTCRLLVNAVNASQTKIETQDVICAINRECATQCSCSATDFVEVVSNETDVASGTNKPSSDKSSTTSSSLGGTSSTIATSSTTTK